MGTDMLSEATEQSSKLVVPEDLQLFIQVCDGRRTDPWASLQVIAKRIDRPVSSISQCLARLEKRYGGTLIVRTPRRGVGELTPLGEKCYDEFRSALESWERLNDGETLLAPGGLSAVQKKVTIATTNSLRLRLLPGPVSAHVIRLRREQEQRATEPPPAMINGTIHRRTQDLLGRLQSELSPEEARVASGAIQKLVRQAYGPPVFPVQIGVEEANFPEMVAGVLAGRYDFAVGWKLPETPEKEFPEIRQETLLPQDVQIGAIISSGPVRGAADDDLGKLFDERDSIPVGLLRSILRRKKVVAVESEHIPALEPLLRELLITQRVWVKSYEDVLAFVRMGLVDLGWVPEYYQGRRHVLFRLLTDDAGPVRRTVVTYSREGEAWPPAGPAGELLKTIQAFVNEKKFKDSKGVVRNFTDIILRRGDADPRQRGEDDRQDIHPKIVAEWVAKRWPPTRR
jgi:DNA-binding transcriptional LysR family regulator